MILLLVGLALWVVGHLWHRFVPDLYKGLGKAGYAVSAVMILGSVVAMIGGYRAADFIPVWSPPAFFTHINNLLVLFAFYTYFTTATQKGVVLITGNLRHPQLTGFKIWAIAHLLVNGDLAAIILFGGLLAWAVVEVILINRQTADQGGDIDRSDAPIKSRIGHLGLVLAVFVVIAGIHAWLGYNPFG